MAKHSVFVSSDRGSVELRREDWPKEDSIWLYLRGRKGRLRFATSMSADLLLALRSSIEEFIATGVDSSEYGSVGCTSMVLAGKKRPSLRITRGYVSVLSASKAQLMIIISAINEFLCDDAKRQAPLTSARGT